MAVPAQKDGLLVASLKWAFDPSNDRFVSGWGFWFGLAGLLLTIVGFWITIWQLRETKSAAEAAKTEAERIERTLKRYDAAQDVVRAENSLAMAAKHFRANEFEAASEHYEEARKAFIALRQNVEIIDDQMKRRIDLASSHILSFCQRVDAGLIEKASKDELAKSLTMIRRHGEKLLSISSQIQKGAF